MLKQSIISRRVASHSQGINNALSAKPFENLRRLTMTMPVTARLAIVLLLLATSTPHTTCAQSFLDITSLTPGQAGVGQFSGTMGTISVHGQLMGGVSTPNNPKFLINGPGGDFSHSTTNGSSAQYADSALFTPNQSLGDKVGYTKLLDPINETATLQLDFSPPIKNPVFHVANLDGMQYDFSPSSPDSLTLLSGNKLGLMDGITVDGNVIRDINPDTLGPDPYSTSSRSAYGSVRINGTFPALEIVLSNTPGAVVFGGDGGNFQLSTVPEPSGLATVLVGLVALLRFKRQPSTRPRLVDNVGKA